MTAQGDAKARGLSDGQDLDKSSPLPRVLTENLNRNLCVCYDVPKKEIIEAFKAGAHTFEEISNKTYACQGSGCCQLQLERLIETLTEHAVAPDVPDRSKNEQT